MRLLRQSRSTERALSRFQRRKVQLFLAFAFLAQFGVVYLTAVGDEHVIGSMEAVQNGTGVLVRVPGFTPMVVVPGSRIYCHASFTVEVPELHTVHQFSGDSKVMRTSSAVIVVQDGVAHRFPADTEVHSGGKHCDVVEPGQIVPSRYRGKAPDAIADSLRKP